MSGILSNAISGLQASQVALRTAGNNISNANTAGYSRQSVEFSARIEQKFGGAGYLGSGVTTESVTRIVNEFITTQLRLDTTTYNQLDKYNNNIGKIDSLFSDTNTGLAGGLQDFFSAMQNSVSDPASTPARQLVINQAESLSVRFNNLYSRLAETEKSVNGEISNIAGKINLLATSIANLNQSIGVKSASNSGGQANDLYDQREEALRQLAELTSVQLVNDNVGNINVFIGNGEPLVVGINTSTLTTDTSGAIFFKNGATAFNITDSIVGGKLGGSLLFKRDALEPAFNELGRIAIVMSDTFNTTQTQGLDLAGNYGNPMFADINDASVSANRVKPGNNAPPNNHVLSVTIEDSSKVTASDYEFTIIPSSLNYTITRSSDKTIVSQGVVPAVLPTIPPTELKFDGLSVHLDAGTFQGGDSFTLQPTRTGANNIHSLLSTPSSLAFAAPMRTVSALGNTGQATITAGKVLSLLDLNNNPLATFATAGQLSPPLLIRFTSDTTYDILDNTNPANPIPLVPAMREQLFIPNRDNVLFTEDKGETLVVGNGALIGFAAHGAASPIVSGSAAQANGYPSEAYTFTATDPVTGAITTTTVTGLADNSAAQTAALLSNVKGVSAHAFTTATISNVTVPVLASPLQITINGEDVLGYTGGVLSPLVPNPNPLPSDQAAFNDYLEAQINSNVNLKSLGIRAESSTNAITGLPELRLVASSGVDLDIRLTGTSAATNMAVDDGSHPTIQLDGVGVGQQSAVTVGGKIDITMATGVVASSAPSPSQLLGDLTLVSFAANSTYKGYQVSMGGQPKQGDVFSIMFNNNAKNDNRNGLVMANLETAKTVQDGSISFGQGYGQLVEQVGTKSNLSSINTGASKSLLEQTKTMRDGISGVNLDEEAANLIEFQQLYSANARVITVARDLFDSLLRSLG